MNRLKKSILSLLVAIIVLISIIAIVGAKTTNSIGDINADGTVSAADARLALRASVGLEKLTDTQFKSADVNNDSKVTAADARTILRVSVGLEKFDIQENTDNKDNSDDSYLSTKNVQDMHKVQKSIEQLMTTKEFQNMEEPERIKLILEALKKLEKNGLIERNSIEYNETTKVINYNHICGISGGISVKQEKTYSDSRLNPIGSTDNEIVANYTRQSNSIQKNKSSTNSVLMYGYDDVNKNESLFNSWKSLCEEKTALNTTIFACPTVYDFKTALLNKDFICIFEHGNYGGFIEDTYVFAIKNEEVTEEKNLAYNTDLYFERIISRTNDKGETNYYITPKFFEFYYKDKLTGAIVYLLSCQGFGKGNIVDYGIADVLIQECGAKTVLGFHNEVAQAYAAEIYDNITNLLINGFTIGDAYDYTIEKLGKSDYTFIKEYLYNFDDMSIRREWLDAANDKKENGAATFLLNGDKSATIPQKDNSDDTEERTVIDSGNCGADGDNVTWTLYEDGELVISGNGKMKNYSYYFFTEDESLSPQYWKYISIINKLTINYGVIYIGTYSFASLKVNSIELPNSINEIGNYAFYNCSLLKEIEISNTCKIIGEGAFNCCHSLTEITLPNSVLVTCGFWECNNLEKLKILNPKCEIDNAEFGLLDVKIIYGYKNSTAQTYAEKYRKTFVALD